MAFLLKTRNQTGRRKGRQATGYQARIKCSPPCFPGVGATEAGACRYPDHTGGQAHGTSVKPIFCVGPPRLPVYLFSWTPVRQRRMDYWWRSRKRGTGPHLLAWGGERVCCLSTRRPSMSLKPHPIPPVPEEPARVAHAAFPRGNVVLQLR